jgi:hypothetical protein
MNRPDSPLSDVDLDVAIAICTSVPVLISASPEDAMKVAASIAGTTDNGQCGPLVVTAASLAQLTASMANAEWARGDRPTTVVVLNIDAIDRNQQNVVMEMLVAHGRTAAVSRWRLITTTSVPLFERVVAGAFESRLFYCLNAIHIIINAQPEASATSPETQAPVL